MFGSMAQRKTLLVVDDNDELRGAIAEQLQLSEDFSAMRDAAARLDVRVKADGVPPCLCHNDFYDPNFLVSGDEMYLIDWEYSAMSDYASDLGTFICCSDYSTEEAEGVLAGSGG